MIDTSTDRPLYVSTDGDASPYIMVPIVQLDAVRRLLLEGNVGFWVDENAVRIDNEPAFTVINLGKGSDPVAIQKILDDAS